MCQKRMLEQKWKNEKEYLKNHFRIKINIQLIAWFVCIMLWNIISILH